MYLSQDNLDKMLKQIENVELEAERTKIERLLSAINNCINFKQGIKYSISERLDIELIPNFDEIKLIMHWRF